MHCHGDKRQGDEDLASLDKCELCPRRCGVNRHQRTGFCGAGAMARVALAGLHLWEEPCLVGGNGAGTVFFSHCNLRCCYCQNHIISHGGQGDDVTDARLAEIFCEQQLRGAATLDLVTPTHFVPNIIRALDMARVQGFGLPVVYNSGGYETVETIAALAGYVDIYLPDLKYISEESGREYSAAPDYPQVAQAAVRAMVGQVGAVDFGEDGRLRKGVLIRHLVLPGHRHESMAVLDWLAAEFGDVVQISLMNQYTPMYRAAEHPPLGRRLTTFEYQSVVEHAQALGLTRVYVQERRAASEEYVPQFDGRGVKKLRQQPC